MLSLSKYEAVSVPRNEFPAVLSGAAAKRCAERQPDPPATSTFRRDGGTPMPSGAGSLFAGSGAAGIARRSLLQSSRETGAAPAGEENMLNAAVVGLGWWGRQIVGCLEGSAKISLTRAVDVHAGAASDFDAAHGLALTAGYDDALADDAIDAVILVTPHALHEAQVIAAAEAGKQVFCEKPFALSIGRASCRERVCQYV